MQIKSEENYSTVCICDFVRLHSNLEERSKTDNIDIEARNQQRFVLYNSAMPTHSFAAGAYKRLCVKCGANIKNDEISKERN